MSTAWKALVLAALIGAVGLVLVLKQRDRTAEQSVVESPPTPTSPVAAGAQALPRLVELGSVTCIPCKMMAPILKDLKQEHTGRLTVEFHDIVQNPDAAKRYGIRVMPTQIFYDAAGNELFRHEGFFAKQDILAKWKELGIDVGADAQSE
jgi:thioredoxin 1